MKKVKEKWIVGPAWPYASGSPHLGNFLPILPADAFARFFRLTGNEVVLVSGSDEHGARVEFEADKQGITPQRLVNKNHQKLLDAINYLNIDFEGLGKYSRTTSKSHEEFVQDFYQKIYENGYIFTKKEELPYCPNCGRFLPDRFVEGTCPKCGYEEALGNQCEDCLNLLDPKDLVEPKCAVCGSEPIFRKTKHWYFDLPKLSDKLKKWIKKQDQWTEKARNLALNWIEEGLEPRAITRDIDFGIPAPFPGAKGKTIYVWAEAVLGYISATKQWAKERGKPELFKKFWKDPNTRLLFTHGKDNIPFHAIIFPALVLASREEYVLPYQIYSHEYLTLEGDPFSKSRGTGIWLEEASKLLDNPDYWRYYLFSIFPEKKDTDFRWDDFERKINQELIANFANFIHRVLTFLEENFDGKLPSFENLEKEDKEIVEKTKEIVEDERELIKNFKLKRGLKKAVELSILGNEYFQHKKPWEKEEDPEDCARTLYISTNICKTLATLIEPYLPYTAERIWNQLNLKGSVHKTNLEKAKELSIEPGHKITEPKLLFEKIKKKKLKEKLKNIRKEK